MSRRSKSSLDSMFRTVTRITKAIEREAKAQQRAYERQQAAYRRYLIQEERNRVRALKAQEMAERRAERERVRSEREHQRAQLLKMKNDELQRLELEMDAIDRENASWLNVHKLATAIISSADIDKAITVCLAERSDLHLNTLYGVECPSKSAFVHQVEIEAENKYHVRDCESSVKEAEKELHNAKLNYSTALSGEPTKDIIVAELEVQAEKEIESLFPWRQKRLGKAYVSERIDSVYANRYSAWSESVAECKSTLDKASSVLVEVKKNLVVQKKNKSDFVESQAESLFQGELVKWKEEREQFFATYLNTLNSMLVGDGDYVLKAIDASFAGCVDGIPMVYYVDASYDEPSGKVKVELDLPEIEDIPTRKVVVGASGKRCIRNKTQVNIKEDYVNCVCGLSVYVAGLFLILV